MFLLIDNYDSFTWNLIQYFEILNVSCKVITNDELSVEEILKLKPSGIILSPGPGAPENAGCCPALVKALAQDSEIHVPILGICLGHQVLATAMGGSVGSASTPIHGKVYQIENDGEYLFNGLPKQFNVVRYHSLSVQRLPLSFTVSAYTKDHEIMAMYSRKYNFYGVQFHPEAILSEYGLDILSNFINICSKTTKNKN